MSLIHGDRLEVVLNDGCMASSLEISKVCLDVLVLFARDCQIVCLCGAMRSALA